MFSKIIGLMIIGVFVVSLFVTLGFISALPWVVVGVLCSVVTGVFGWLINLFSKTREVERSTKGKVMDKKNYKQKQIVNKEIVLEDETYEIFQVDLEKGEQLIGEVSSEGPINAFLVTKYSLNKFENQEEFSYEDCGGGEGIKRSRIDFTPSKTGTWFLVIENETKEDTSVEIRLIVRPKK